MSNSCLPAIEKLDTQTQIAIMRHIFTNNRQIVAARRFPQMDEHHTSREDPRRITGVCRQVKSYHARVVDGIHHPAG